MERERKGNSTRDVRRRSRSKEDSDEDYVVENDTNESDDDLEDLGNSLYELTAEESFGSFVDSGEEDEEEEDTDVVRLKKSKNSLKKNGKTGPKTVRKRKKVSSKEDEDEDYVCDDDDIDNDDEEYYEDENEEFISDENDDYLNEDEAPPLIRRNRNNFKLKQVKRNMQRKCSGRGQKRRKSKVLCKPMQKKGMNNKRLKKKGKRECVDKGNRDFTKNGFVVGETSRKTVSMRRKYAVHSDSDLVSSGLSDYEYTISEEEREQVREASELFGVKTSLRGSSSKKRILEDEGFCQQREPLHRKGKEKVKKIMPNVVKQVCGICLSEEDNRRWRGSLNCCSHYFCFTCIMEWSKVESRCPLCKQRFKTITKNGRSTPGFDLRNVVIQVPQRDQVYQPSEEEIRSFIDSYENVMCTVCHEAGDGGLMLLCDLCDSPTHTYCVGLGQQVPEGNWYCDDCRPVALGSSSSPTQNSLVDQRTASNDITRRPSPIRTFESLDPILESYPRVTFAQGLGNLSSPRFATGDGQVASPVYGSGAPTLSNRREIHRRIQSIISITRMNHMFGRSGGFPAVRMRSDLSNPQTDQARETDVQNSRIQEIGASQHAFYEDRLQANHCPSSSVQYSDSVSSRSSQFCGQVVQDPIVAAAHESTNLVAGSDELHCNSRSSIASHSNLSHAVGEFYTEMEQLKSMVRSHLKSLSQDIELGQDIFNHIESSSTKAILAACGREPSHNDDYTVPRPSSCTHVDEVPVGHKSMIENLCFSCFDSFVKDVVEKILDTKKSPWLRLGL